MTPAARAAWPPRLMRVVLTVALASGLLVSVASAQGAAEALTIDTLNAPEVDLGRLEGLLPYAREQQAALKAQQLAALSAIEGMAGPRAAVLALLAAAALLVFLTALQVRWSPERPRVALARRLGVLGLVTAGLRTLDGAQTLVIVRHAAAASGKVLLASQVPDAQLTADTTQALITVGSVAWTALVVALFFTVSRYFSSPQVQGVFDPTAADADDDG